MSFLTNPVSPATHNYGPVQQPRSQYTKESIQQALKSFTLPETIRKVDAPHHDLGLAHIHFHLGLTLNEDGAWSHNKGKKLSDEESAIVRALGFRLPDNSQWETEDPKGPDRSYTRYSVEAKILPETIKRIDQAHDEDREDHIHFTDRRVLFQSGTWRHNDSRVLSNTEEVFIKTLWPTFQLRSSTIN